MKQLLVFRKDLKMSWGKKIVQGAHGSIGAFVKAQNLSPKWVSSWESLGQKKVAVRVDTLEDMLELFEFYKRKKIPAFLVRDAGMTELEPGTITVLAIGPAPDIELDVRTKHLQLV